MPTHPDTFKNTYRIPTNRLHTWDYSTNGYYFITICTQEKEPWFGKIIDGRMKLSKAGEIVMQNWMRIPNHFPNTTMDECVVMPDHMHGIVVIKNMPRTCMHTRRDVALLRLYKSEMSVISPKPGSLPAVIRSFKSASSKSIRQFIPSFQWQPRYYDRIIRDERELCAIREYIRMNPKRFEKT